MLKIANHTELFNGADTTMTSALAEACALAKRGAMFNNEEAIVKAAALAVQDLPYEAVEEIANSIRDAAAKIDPELAKVANPILKGLGAAMVSGNLIRSGLDMGSRNQRLTQSFREMLRKFPAHRDQPDAVADAFQIVARYAPSIASDPVAAGNIVSNIVRLGQGAVNPMMIKELIETETARRQGQEIPGLAETGKALMSLGKD